MRLFGARWTHLDAPRHLFLIPIDTLARAASDAGLEVAAVTTADAGTLGWNRFGWSETLAHSVRSRTRRTRCGSSAGPRRARRSVERRGRRGATYTVALRRPAAPQSPQRP